MKTLVVPTIRPKHLNEFLTAWEGRGGWDRVIVVEDNPTRTFEDLRIDAHYSWAEIEALAGPASDIFSRRDSAIRCFGFLAAYKTGATHVLTMDDDCFPLPGTEDLFGDHLRAMAHPVWVPSVPGTRTRGLPYKNLGTVNADINCGLWTNAGDPDAVQALGMLAQGKAHRFDPPKGSRLLARNQLAPQCGMNLCFTARAVPLMYFPLMGLGQPFGRFDDIFAGVISQTIAHHLGWSVSFGDPHVEHLRASDPFKNLVKEAPGVLVNETFWERVTGAELPTAVPPALCVRGLGAVLSTDPDPYVAKVGSCLVQWARLCESDLVF